MINFNELKDVIVEDLAHYLDRDKEDIAKALVDDDVEYAIGKMLDELSSVEAFISSDIENRIIDAEKDK